jgi:hypothetical protein
MIDVCIPHAEGANMIAAIYARKSTEQTNAQSVTRQVENARVFADARLDSR